MKAKTDHDLLWQMIKDIRFAMLTHRHADGALHAHPMTTQNKSIEVDGMLYFFMSKATEVGQRLRTDGNVNVSYADHSKDIYISLAGQATISEDDALKQKLFNPLNKAWFPGGWDDPNLELVAVRIEHAEYWNVKESKLTQLLKIATAAVTHESPDLGVHRDLHVNSPAKQPIEHN
jgi:general stress protein 26